MEQFYLKNLAKYHSLVGALDPMPMPRISSGIAGPNMVVSARIKPLSTEEEFPSAIFPRSMQQNVVDIHDLYNHPKGLPILKSSDYQVDQVFGPDSTTDEIFRDLVADLVPFAWNGGIGTLFAYGQTGSGKTFTISRMEQLVSENLFNKTLLDGDREIYMTIIDLAGNTASDLLNKRQPISLLQDTQGAMQMMGVTEHQVHSQQEMSTLISLATSFRLTASTLKNDTSSRSHAICRIRIKNPTTATDSNGLLYLIDLAGSEAARDVAVHGADRMRETREINNSLSVLKDCIRGKAEADALLSPSTGQRKPGVKMPHIPFRRSALTKVLKHVFDPTEAQACKTVVIACVSSSLADVGPSKNTLRFAELLRVVVPPPPTFDLDQNVPTKWTNTQLKSWIKENAGTPPILPTTVAPRESGSEFFKLTSREIEYRCQKCPGVRAEQAKAFRRKLWMTQVEAQQEIARAMKREMEREGGGDEVGVEGVV